MVLEELLVIWETVGVMPRREALAEGGKGQDELVDQYCQ